MTFIAALAVVCLQIAVPASQQQEPVSQAQLAVEAGVQLRNGDVKRVARTPVILLDADFGEKLLQVYPKGLRNVQLQAATYLARKRYEEMAGKPHNEQVIQMDEFLKTHTIATAMTDFDGRSSIPAPAGEYFVFCVFELADNHVVWSVPVQLKAGQNSIVLDHNNTR